MKFFSRDRHVTGWSDPAFPRLCTNTSSLDRHRAMKLPTASALSQDRCTSKCHECFLLRPFKNLRLSEQLSGSCWLSFVDLNPFSCRTDFAIKFCIPIAFSQSNFLAIVKPSASALCLDWIVADHFPDKQNGDSDCPCAPWFGPGKPDRVQIRTELSKIGHFFSSRKILLFWFIFFAGAGKLQELPGSDPTAWTASEQKQGILTTTSPPCLIYTEILAGFYECRDSGVRNAPNCIHGSRRS